MQVTAERSPRERILGAATTLFYRHGIHATGVEELAAVAGVSKRTLYKLFNSKDELVAAYLERMSREIVVPSRRAKEGPDLAPRERLLALFDRPRAALSRGCPLHNAAVELTEPGHPAHPVILAHKLNFLRLLIDTARQANASDPEALGRELFVLFEGATALATSIDSLESFDFARPVAAALLDAAIPHTDADAGPGGRSPARR